MINRLVLIMCSIFSILLLVGCKEIHSSVNVQKSIQNESVILESYHIFVIQKDYKGMLINDQLPEVPNLQSIANASVIKSNGGQGTRIDKVDGVVKNHVEVISNEQRGLIRYHQNPWEETVTPLSSLQNVIIYPYEKMVQFTEKIQDEVEWMRKRNSYQANFEGTSIIVANALTDIVGIQATPESEIKLNLVTNDKGDRLEKILVIIKNGNEEALEQKHIEIKYNGFNQQTLKSFPQKTISSF